MKKSLLYNSDLRKQVVKINGYMLCPLQSILLQAHPQAVTRDEIVEDWQLVLQEMLCVLVQGEVVLVKINLPVHVTQQTQLMDSILIKNSPDILQHSLAYDPAVYMVASVLGWL